MGKTNIFENMEVSPLATLVSFVSKFTLPVVTFFGDYISEPLRAVLPYYILIGSLFILWVMWNHKSSEAIKRKLDQSKLGALELALDQMDNAFISVESKCRKKAKEEHFKQKLKTIEEKKEVKTSKNELSPLL